LPYIYNSIICVTVYAARLRRRLIRVTRIAPPVAREGQHPHPDIKSHCRLTLNDAIQSPTLTVATLLLGRFARVRGTAQSNTGDDNPSQLYQMVWWSQPSNVYNALWAPKNVILGYFDNIKRTRLSTGDFSIDITPGNILGDVNLSFPPPKSWLLWHQNITRNAWQSLACSQRGIAVTPPSA